MSTVPKPTTEQLRMARDRFAALLAKPDPPEREFHQLFTECPYVLTQSLPLRLENCTVASARPGESLPDLVFYPAPSLSSRYTVPIPVELKKPGSLILTTQRKNVVVLTRDAATAVGQCQRFLESAQLTIPSYEPLFLGSVHCAFVIMGLTGELRKKLATDISLPHILPPGFSILPYDHVLELYSQQVPPRLYFTFDFTAEHALNPEDTISITFSKHDISFVFRLAGSLRAAGLSVSFDCFSGGGRTLIGAIARTAMRGQIVVLSRAGLSDVQSGHEFTQRSETLADTLKKGDTSQAFQVLSLDNAYSDALLRFYLEENPQARYSDWSSWTDPATYDRLFAHLATSMHLPPI